MALRVGVGRDPVEEHVPVVNDDQGLLDGTAGDLIGDRAEGELAVLLQADVHVVGGLALVQEHFLCLAPVKGAGVVARRPVVVFVLGSEIHRHDVEGTCVEIVQHVRAIGLDDRLGGNLKGRADAVGRILLLPGHDPDLLIAQGLSAFVADDAGDGAGGFWLEHDAGSLLAIFERE